MRRVSIQPSSHCPGPAFSLSRFIAFLGGFHFLLQGQGLGRVFLQASLGFLFEGVALFRQGGRCPLLFFTQSRIAHGFAYGQANRQSESRDERAPSDGAGQGEGPVAMTPSPGTLEVTNRPRRDGFTSGEAAQIISQVGRRRVARFLGSFCRHLRQIVSRSRGVFGLSCLGGTASVFTTIRIVSRLFAARKGGRPVRHS